MQRIVYIKPEKNSEIHRSKVELGQVASVYSEDQVLECACRKMVIFRVPQDEAEKDGRYVFSVLKLVELIQHAHPGVEVVCIGEVDFIVDYQPHPQKINAWEYLKTGAICLVVFVGAAFAIMTFNNDGDVSKIFSRVYELVMGTASDGHTLLELGYSVGLPLGIIVFFNHFSSKHLTKDPTPIEVQMRLYEDDVDSTLIQNANREDKEKDAT